MAQNLNLLLVRRRGSTIDASDFDGGTIKFYTGADAADAGDLLASGSIPGHAFENADGDGIRALRGSWSAVATKNGTVRGILLSSADAIINKWLEIGVDVTIDHSDVQIGDILTLATLDYDTSPPVGGTTVFYDDFASGDFTHTENGVSWIDNTFVDVVTAAGIGTGKFARFREGDSGGLAELRFDGLNNLQELFLERCRYFPTGSESPTVGPKMKCIGTLNDKDWRLWGNDDVGYDGYPTTGRISLAITGSHKFVRTTGSFITDGFQVGKKAQSTWNGVNAVANSILVTPNTVTALELTVDETLTNDVAAADRIVFGYNNKVGGSTRGDSGHQDGQVYAEFCFSNPAAGAPQYPMGEVLGNGGSTFYSGTQTHVDLITDAYRGRQFVERIRVKQATTANNDGVIQVWLDDVLVLDFQGLSNGDIYSLTTPGYTTGYLRGAANNSWPAGQYEYLKYFRISTGGFVG
jgi:hypothetical protein